jgi:predicted phosphodiesterase
LKKLVIKPQKYPNEDLEESYVLGMMTKANADVLCIGNSHLPYHRIIGDKHVVNNGSVGKPKDGNPKGCYVLLTIEDNIQV